MKFVQGIRNQSTLTDSAVNHMDGCHNSVTTVFVNTAPRISYYRRVKR